MAMLPLSASKRTSLPISLRPPISSTTTRSPRRMTVSSLAAHKGGTGRSTAGSIARILVWGIRVERSDGGAARHGVARAIMVGIPYHRHSMRFYVRLVFSLVDLLGRFTKTCGGTGSEDKNATWLRWRRTGRAHAIIGSVRIRA